MVLTPQNLVHHEKIVKNTKKYANDSFNGSEDDSDEENKVEAVRKRLKNVI